MLKSEYEKLVGEVVTESEYRSIESIYMESTLDKVDFCKIHGLKWLVSFRYEQVVRYEKMIQTIKEFAEKEQFEGRKDHDDKSDMESEKTVLNTFGGSQELYAYNRRIMGLQQSITAGDVLNRIQTN